MRIQDHFSISVNLDVAQASCDRLTENVCRVWRHGNVCVWLHKNKRQARHTRFRLGGRKTPVMLATASVQVCVPRRTQQFIFPAFCTFPTLPWLLSSSLTFPGFPREYEIYVPLSGRHEFTYSVLYDDNMSHVLMTCTYFSNVSNCYSLLLPCCMQSIWSVSPDVGIGVCWRRVISGACWRRLLGVDEQRRWRRVINGACWRRLLDVDECRRWRRVISGACWRRLLGVDECRRWRRVISRACGRHMLGVTQRICWRYPYRNLQQLQHWHFHSCVTLAARCVWHCCLCPCQLSHAAGRLNCSCAWQQTHIN